MTAGPALEASSSPAGRSDERLRAGEKLHNRVQFQRCYRQGRRVHRRYLSLHFLSNDVGHPRVGITTSRKVGNAVARHAVRRRLREVYRRSDLRRHIPAVDLVLHVRPGAGEADFDALRKDLLSGLRALDRPAKQSRKERSR